MMKNIKHRAKYNNYISELIDELENTLPDLGIYARLLAMETSYKEWTAQKIKESNSSSLPFITQEMLETADDEQVLAATELHKEVQELLFYLSDYWQTTDEIKSELN